MRRTVGSTILAALALLALLTLRGEAQTGTANVTTIAIPDMHCMGCAKKMAAQLYQVPGVAKVQADVPSLRLIVTPRSEQAPSPKGLWEAVEKAGYRPSRLEGPNGTFTSKPRV